MFSQSQAPVAPTHGATSNRETSQAGESSGGSAGSSRGREPQGQQENGTTLGGLASESQTSLPSETPLEARLTRRRSKTDKVWDGLLEFLNDPACYHEAGLRRQGTTLLFEEPPRRRRYAVVCRKVVQMCTANDFRPLDRTHHFARLRNRVGRIGASPLMKLILAVVILADLSNMVRQWTQYGFGEKDDNQDVVWLEWTVACVVSFEVSCRIVYVGQEFTHSLLNLIEAALVPVMFADILLEENKMDTGGLDSSLLRTLRPVARIASVAAKLIVAFKSGSKLRQMLQAEAGCGLRRYTQNGFNLDLCYITPQIIAMGRPAMGMDAFYNNPSTEVERFFLTQHRDKFIVVNASANYSYFSVSARYSHRQIRLPMLPHGVPKLNELWDLCAALQEFLEYDDGHVVAVHGSTDRGSVGMVVGALLLYMGAFRQATGAMMFYERVRSSPFSRYTVHGLDCASQRRFLDAFCTCVHDLKAVPTPPRTVRLKSVKLVGVGGAGDRLSVRVIARSGDRIRCEASRDSSVAEAQENAGDAMLLMTHRDELISIAHREQESHLFDSPMAGCFPNPSAALLDTSISGDPRIKGVRPPRQRHQEDEGGYWVREFEGVELTGEVCFEVYCQRAVSAQMVDTWALSVAGDSHSGWRRDLFLPRLWANISEDNIPHTAPGPASHVSPPEIPASATGVASTNTTSVAAQYDAKQMLFASWLQTSLLEIWQSSRGRRPSAEAARSIQVTLRRFDVDKARGVPAVAETYGPSLEMQLTFEVDRDKYLDLNNRTLKQRRIPLSKGKSPPMMGVTKSVRTASNSVLNFEEAVEEGDLGWLTWCVERLWPYADAALLRVIRKEVEPLLQEMVPKPFNNIRFSSFSLGQATPVLGPVVASKRRKDSISGGGGLQMCIDINYKGDANIVIDTGIAKVGVNHVSLEGKLSLLFDVVSTMPVVAGMKLFFASSPVLKLNFVGWAEVANFSFLQSYVQNALDSALGEAIVLPNFISVSWNPEDLMNGEPSSSSGTITPTEVLRVVVKRATGRLNASEDKARRYWCAARLSHQVARTSKSERTREPHWDESLDLLLFDREQTLVLEVWAHRTLEGDVLVASTMPQEVWKLLRITGSRVLELLPPRGYHLDSKCEACRALSGEGPGMKGHLCSACAARALTVDVLSIGLKADAELLPKATAPTEADASDNSAHHRFPRVPIIPRLTTRHPLPPPPVKNEWPGAVLVCTVMKCRITPVDRAAGASLVISVGDVRVDQKFVPAPADFLALEEVDDPAMRAVEAMVMEGMTCERIAAALGMQEPLVRKLIGHVLEYNVHLPKRRFLLLKPSAVLEGEIRVEMHRKGNCEGSERLQMQVVASAPYAKFRRLLVLTSSREEAQKIGKAGKGGAVWQSNVDIEFALLACVPPSGESAASSATHELDEAFVLATTATRANIGGDSRQVTALSV